MFYFILLIFFLVIITLHFISQYRLKAIKTGEAGLSPLDKSILPFCSVCKVCSVILFFILFSTGIFLLAARSFGSEFLFLSGDQWVRIHMSFVILFVILFVFLTYLHSSWLRKAFDRKLRPVR
jgi:hypothetical protein